MRMSGEQELQNIELERMEILRRAREYLAKGRAEMETGSSLSMRHILNSALSPLNMLVELSESSPDEAKEWLKKESFDLPFKTIDSYLELLEKYPHFKAGEKAEQVGYFADKKIKVPVRVDAYREALEKEIQG
jgi:hypothetical protein